VQATPGGFALLPRGAGTVRLLLPPIESPDAAVMALLADGEGWSTSALALALGSSQRTVQRALRTLEESGQARSVGRGRSQRWLSAPIAGFATTLLLPGSEGFG
jgi:DNA-binding transcriptional ArsR family regulator